MAVEVLNDFSFRTFLSSEEVYKVGIRNKGQALININDFTPLNEDEIQVILSVTRRLDNNEQQFVLVFRQANEIYNIPVKIKSRQEEKDYILKKVGQVVYIEDRRDYQRIEMDKKVEYSIASQRNINHLHTGVIEDISASGAQLVTTRELDTSNLIVLNTTFMELPLDKLFGKIVWKEEGTSRKYHNGIQFQFDEPEDQTVLIDHLYNDGDDEEE